MNSTNFSKLLQLNRQLSAVTDNLETLFLNYNVDSETLSLFNEQLEEMLGAIDAVRMKEKQIDSKT